MRNVPPSFRRPGGEPRRPQPRSRRAGRLWWLSLVGLFLLLVFASSVASFYTDLLWFRVVGYSQVFWTGIWARLASFGVGLVAAIAILGGNLWLARALTRREPLFIGQERPLDSGLVSATLIAVTAIFGLSFAAAVGAQWNRWLLFFHRRPFGVAEPIFGQDIGFYLFQLPVWRFAQGWLLGLLFLTLLGVTTLYALNRLPQFQLQIYGLPRYMRIHLAVLAALLVLDVALGYQLDRFDLLYSTRGVVFGASYTDVNATLPALNLQFVVAVMAALLILAWIVTGNKWLPGLAVGAWLVLSIVAGGIYPTLVQNYAVKPNEFVREQPYIEHHIAFTRRAFGLDRVREQDYVPKAEINSATLNDNASTISNVRLWDYRPLTDTYAQIQEIRSYYEFVDVDIDRYWVDGQYRQVTLAARELAAEQLQNRTWVNEHLEFTHGYGIVMSPVNEVTREGLPNLWVKDLPPQTLPDLRIERPEIYYGEKGTGYVIVKSRAEEFDYPKGDTNVRTRYQGRGGVPIDTFLKRLAFGYRFGDSQILFTQALVPDSRVLLYRNVHDLVRRVAPFLVYDRDPYLVVADGRLVWLQDAYTVSDRYPYSKPYNDQFNYIRNAVKVTIDAYDGRPTFYIADPSDPLIQSYAAIYPTLFVPISQMPKSLRDHVRYPEDLYRVQALVFATYHMRQANVFYNKEDVWAIPEETFQGNKLPLEPYYVIMRLLGETDEEFLLMQPFTPATKNNLIAWMAARCDGERYGDLVVYKFPKQELIYGPLQIEARIDQDPTISAQLSLWNQRGSRVIRGNLLVIPVAESLIYFEPIYLQAETGQIPELKRVVVAFGDRVAMEETLDRALTAVFGTAPVIASTGPASQPTGGSVPAAISSELADLARSAQAHYDAAQAALRSGNWAKYGEELEALRQDLAELVRLTGGEEQP
jgi:uncharacterized membrane protein (UPF0182 family)